MLENKPPRNSWLQTHQNDDAGSGAAGSASGVSQRRHRIDRFADASKNSRRMPPFTASTVGGWRLRLLLLGLWNQPALRRSLSR